MDFGQTISKRASLPMAEEKVFENISVAIVDDHDLIREGFSSILTKGGFVKIDQYKDATDFIEHLDGGRSYDIYIIDLELPDIDGFVLIEMIRARHSGAHIIVSTVHDEIWTLRKILARDVNAVIYKSDDGNEIITAIKEILDGRNYYCKGVLSAMEQAKNPTMHPTARELEVLHQLSLGKTSKEIAAAMFVTDNTVESHRKALFSKLGAVNVADLIVKAIDKGYLTKHGGRQ